MSTPNDPSLQQEVSLIPNKVDKDGHHYLKVLLLSNKVTKNNWIAPFKKIGDLPAALKESFLEVPGVYQHNHELFDKIDEILKKEGKSRDERYQLLRQESSNKKGGYIDFIFDQDPNADVLYGQFKVTDPAENKYIEEHGEPSLRFTSPAVSGTYVEDDNGVKIYDLDTMKAFHLAFVPIPAFDEQDAMVKGVCKNGNSESCREALAYAGIDQAPSENVNNTCGCNKGIMSANNAQVEKTEVTKTIEEKFPSGNNIKYAENQPKVEYKIESPVTDAPKGEKPKVQESGEIFKSQKEIDAENREKELQATIKALQKRDEERNNFFLEELLTTHIPRENFQKDEEYDGEKTNLKNFILKYNVSLEDAKWFIKKSVPKTVEVEKKTKDKPQYAGYNNTYNSDYVVKPASVSAPRTSGVVDKETPILF